MATQLSLGECVLRGWRAEDAPALARHANNPRVARQLRDAFPHPYTLADAERFLERAVQSEPLTLFAIARGDEAIGSIGLFPGVDVHRRTAELGYWLAETYWGRGITTRAVQAIVAYAFEELQLVRVYAEPFANNPASARVLERAGMQREGVLRANAIKHGVVLDQLLYAIVRAG